MQEKELQVLQEAKRRMTRCHVHVKTDTSSAHFHPLQERHQPQSGDDQMRSGCPGYELLLSAEEDEELR